MKKRTRKKIYKNNVYNYFEYKLEFFKKRISKKYHIEENKLNALLKACFDHDCIDFDEIEENIKAMLDVIRTQEKKEKE